KLRFGELIGFLVAFNIWIWTVILLSELGIVIANNLAYAVGPSGAWIAESKWIILGAGIIISASLMLTARRGLAFGKWVHNLGGATLIFLFSLITILALVDLFSRRVASVPVALSLPALTLYNLNIFGKMSFGAFSGFDGVAVFTGEFRTADAARS